LSWTLLRQKTLFYAEQLGHDLNSFKATSSDYFMLSVLKKGNKKCVALHGEEMEMSKEDKALHRAVCSLREHMENYDVPADHIYNAYQTGLFNNKLPNRIYIDKEEQDYRGIKQMKSKD